jgi:hypothetical protein
LVIGIKVRIGDHVLALQELQMGYNLLDDVDSGYVSDHFSCALELEHSIRQNLNNDQRRTVKISWLLLADSFSVRLAAKHRYGNKLIVDVSRRNLHPLRYVELLHLQNQSDLVESQVSAAGDILSFSLADYHVVTKESGFGRIGAWLSIAQASSPPRRHVFNIEKGVHRSCRVQDADDFLVDSEHWAGI